MFTANKWPLHIMCCSLKYAFPLEMKKNLGCVYHCTCYWFNNYCSIHYEKNIISGKLRLNSTTVGSNKWSVLCFGVVVFKCFFVFWLLQRSLLNFAWRLLWQRELHCFVFVLQLEAALWLVSLLPSGTRQGAGLRTADRVTRSMMLGPWAGRTACCFPPQDGQQDHMIKWLIILVSDK